MVHKILYCSLSHYVRINNFGICKENRRECQSPSGCLGSRIGGTRIDLRHAFGSGTIPCSPSRCCWTSAVRRRIADRRRRSSAE